LFFYLPFSRESPPSIWEIDKSGMPQVNPVLFFGDANYSNAETIKLVTIQTFVSCYLDNSNIRKLRFMGICVRRN